MWTSHILTFILRVLMNFPAKVFSVVIGATLTAYAGSKLQKVHQMERPISDGTFNFDGNKNCKIRGSDCSGRITGNSNSDIKCEETNVELLNNRNMRIDISKSIVKAIDESNSVVSATSSTLEMKSNKNVQIDAEDAWCNFEDNKNLNFKGKGGANEFRSQFIGNKNGKFTGRGNRILASNNKNMLIEYDNNDLEISETRNHNVRPAATGSNENTFTVRSSGKDSIQYVVEYVGSAVINGSNYQLGTIKFNATTSANKVNVTLHEAEDVIYSVEAFTPDEIVVQAESDGIIQKLGLKGDRVEAVNLNSYNIFVNSG